MEVLDPAEPLGRPRSGWLDLVLEVEELHGDRERVLEACRRCGAAALKFAGPSLRADRELVLEALRSDVDALQFAGEALRADRELFMDAVRHDGRALRFAGRELQADRDLVLHAVRSHGAALAFASWELQRDREVVLEAVRRVGSPALASASPELRDDPLLAPHAAQANPLAVRGAGAPCCRVEELLFAHDAIQYRAVVGLGHREVRGALLPDASLGDLGRRLREHAVARSAPAALQEEMEAEDDSGVAGRVYLLLPGERQPVSPLDVCRLVREFVAA